MSESQHRLDAASDGWRKILRFTRIYGCGRTLFKVAGRLRQAGLVGRIVMRARQRDVAMIGCGQFAFATIGYFLGRRFVECYDPASAAAATFARFYGAAVAESAQIAMAQAAVKIVYIASNHATHAPYAAAALRAGKVVYVEKPIAVSTDQLRDLLLALRSTGGRLFAGYNRPHSAAIRRLRGYCKNARGPLTLSCFIAGHRLAAEHWYRHPAEGTRICGNVGHWLDLAVHILCWDNLPDRWLISLTWSDPAARDDDMAICLSSERGDLINIVLTARTEPFEGINETINFQWGGVIAKIDDFRRMDVWRGALHRVLKTWPKDVGHRRAILQPFAAEKRPWREVELSTLLMLQIARMVQEARQSAEFSFSDAWGGLGLPEKDSP
jgi:predicted dehydrogenase